MLSQDIISSESTQDTKILGISLIYLVLGAGLLYLLYPHKKRGGRSLASRPIRSIKTNKRCPVPGCGGYMERHSRGRKGSSDYDVWYYCPKCGEYLEI